MFLAIMDIRARSIDVWAVLVRSDHSNGDDLALGGDPHPAGLIP